MTIFSNLKGETAFFPIVNSDSIFNCIITMVPYSAKKKKKTMVPYKICLYFLIKYLITTIIFIIIF